MEPRYKISFVRVGSQLGCWDVVFHPTSRGVHYVAVSLYAIVPNPGNGWRILSEEEIRGRLLEWGFEIHREQAGPIPDGTVNPYKPIAIESDKDRRALMELLTTESHDARGHASQG